MMSEQTTVNLRTIKKIMVSINEILYADALVLNDEIMKDLRN